MKFPVDLLADASQAELEQSAHNYMNNLLLHSNLDSPEYLTLPDSSKVSIEISNVGLVPLYGSNDEQKTKILGLFSPSNVLNAVALHLLDQWWTVDDILKTADPARDGVVEVQTIGERIVLYILNRLIYRAKEMSSEDDEPPFLLHGEKDYAKIHWSNGEAVGFYSVKPSGSLCRSFSTRSYQLPVMDSIFVRKCHRGKGFGLQMLENFVLSFKEEQLGLKYPLTKAMYKVCGKYLREYPGDTDVLLEVEGVGMPNQRTNIASKIQTMDLSAVSKNLSFMEEPLVITEVTDNDVVMEAITTQIEAGSVECTVEIVEEMTVLRATKEADDVPVTARGRSSGSKRQKTGEKITRDKSEKVIRIEDIEAETPTEERISELVQTDTVLSVATEENAEEEVDDAAEESAQNLEQAEVTSAPTAKECQVEDDGIKDLNDTSCDAPITVENVASELEEAEEEIQEEDTAVLVVSEDILEGCKEGETLDKVEETTQNKVSDESSEESTHELSLSTHATSEGGDARKKGRPLGKTIKTIQSETPRRRSQRLSKPEVKEETIAQDDKKVLRGRTVVNSPAILRKYHRHSQKVCEELDKEVNKVTEEKEQPTSEVLEGSTATEGQEAEEIIAREENAVTVEEITEEKLQQLTNEEKTEKHEDTGVEDTIVEESATELPETQEIEENALTKVKEDENVTQAEMSLIEDKDKESDDEIEEPPVVQRRAFRERRKATPKPKPIKQSKKGQQQEEADEQQVEQDKMTDKPEEESEEATAVGEGDASKAGEEEDIISLAEVNPESKVVQDASETVMLEKSQDETVSEELHENDTGSEIPKLQKKEQMEPEAAERDVSTSVAEEQTPEPEKLAVEEEETQEKITAEETGELKEESSEKEKEEIPNVDNTETEVEEALVIETRVLQSGRKTVKASRRSTRSKQQQEKDEAVETDTDVVEVEGEVEAVAEKLPAVSETDADAVVDIPVGHDTEQNLLPTEVDEAVNLDEEQASVVETRALRNRTKTVTSTPSNKTVAENSQIEQPTVTTRSLRRGKITISATPKSRITRKQIQEAEDEEAGQEAAIEKTDKQMEEKPEEEIGEETKMEAETSEPKAEVEEGNAVSEEAVSEQAVVEEKSEVISMTLGMAVEKEVPEEDTMTTTEEEKSIAGEAAAADDAEREGETDPPSTKPAADSAIPTPCEEEAPSAEELQSNEAQLSDLPRVTVVLVDVKKTYHEVQEETAVVEEGSKEETAAEGEDEQKELMEEEQVAEENVPGSPVGAGEPEQEVLVAQEEGQVENVEDAVTVHSTEEGSAEETAEVDEVKTADEEEEPAGNKTKTRRSDKEAVKATPRRKSARNRKDEVQQKVEETVSENSEEEPATRVLRGGRKSVPATQRRATRRTHKRQQEEDGGEESTAVEEREAKEQEEEAVEQAGEQAEEQQQMADQEKGEGLEEDMPPQVEKLEPDMSAEKEDTVAEEAVTQQDVPEDTQASTSEMNEEAETPAGEHVVGETLEEAAVITIQDTEETEQSTSITEVDDTAAGERTQETLLTTKDDETKSVSEEEETPVVEARVLRSGGKTVKATTRRQATKIQVEEAAGEKSTDEDEPTVETRVLRRGRKSAPATPRHKSKRARTQPETEEEAEESAPAVETEEEEAPVAEARVMRRVTRGRQTTKIQDEEAGLGLTEKPLTEDDEGKATEEVGKEESVAVEVEEGLSEEATMTTIEEEESTAGEAAAADDAEREGETDPPSTKPAADSAIPTPCEEEAPSAEELQSNEAQLSDLPRVTVVLMDVKKTYHEVQEETAIVEEGSKEETAAEGEDEQKELMEEEQVAEENVPGSPVGAGEPEQEVLVAQEEGQVENVEDAVTVHSTEEGSAEETAKVDEVKTADEEEEPAGNKTKTCRSDKEAVKATPRRKSARNRKDEVQQKVEETVSENSEEEPAARVLRGGRKSVPATQRRATRRTHKRQQEEDGGEESTAVEEREAKEQEEEAVEQAGEQAEEQQQMADQEKGEGLEEDMPPQVEKLEPDMSAEKEDTVAEEAVTQQDVPEDTQASTSEMNEEAETPAGEHVVGETLEEAAVITIQDTEETEQSTSITEVDDTAAGERTQETLLTTKDDETKSVSEEEETPVVEARVLRSGGKTARRQATQIQDEEAGGEKSTEEDEPTVETRVLRRGRKSAPATPRRKSKRARTQPETEEEGEQETAPTEEIQAEEIKEDQKEDDQDQKIDEKVEEQKEENTEAEVEMEEVQPVAEVALTEQDTVEEEPSAIAETSAGEQGETVVGESAEETPPTDETMATNEEEETPVVETRALRSGGKTERATKIRQTTKVQDEEASGEKSTEEDEPTVETRILRRGRKSAPATPRRKSKRARTQPETEEEAEQETAPTEEIKADQKEDDQDQKIDEKVEEPKEENTEAAVEMEEVQPVAEVALTEQDTVEEEPSAIAETSADEQGETVVGESAEETPPTDDTVATNEEEETPVVETRALRSGGKTERATKIRQTTKVQDEEASGEKSTEEDEPTVETRILRRGRKSAPATPRRKSKRACMQPETEEAAEENATAVETQEEEEAGQVSQEEKAEGEAKSMETDVEEEKVQSVTGGESAAGDAEQTKPEKCDSNEEAVEDASVVAEQEAQAVTRTVRSRTKTSHVPQISERHKDQAVAEIQQQEEENPEVEQTAIHATEDQTEETADMVDDPIVEPADEETATEERQSPEEELSGSEENKTMSSKGSRSLRSRAKTDGDEEESPQRRSMRNRPRVDYRENEEEGEGDVNIAINEVEEDKVESNVAKDIKETEEESNQEGNLENNIVINESTSEKGDILHLVLETDEEVEATGVSQEVEEDEQNISEEKEPIVMGKRALRGRSVPSVVITPGPKSKRSSAKVHESFSDEESEKSPQPAPRSLRKRKASPTPTPTRKSKRHSRV